MSQFGTAILNAKAIGSCEILDTLIKLDLDKLTGESDDAEQFRLDTIGPSSAS